MCSVQKAEVGRRKKCGFLCLLLILLWIRAAGNLLKEYLQAVLHGHFSTAQLVNASKSGLVTFPEIKPLLPEEESLRTEKSGCIFFLSLPMYFSETCKQSQLVDEKYVNQIAAECSGDSHQ